MCFASVNCFITEHIIDLKCITLTLVKISNNELSPIYSRYKSNKLFIMDRKCFVKIAMNLTVNPVPPHDAIFKLNLYLCLYYCAQFYKGLNMCTFRYTGSLEMNSVALSLRQ